MKTQQEWHTKISDMCTKSERYTTYIPFETVCMNLRSAGVRSVVDAECTICGALKVQSVEFRLCNT